MRFSISTHPSQCLVFVLFLILDSIIDLQLYLMVAVYISLMTTDAEYISMCLFGTHISYLVK